MGMKNSLAMTLAEKESAAQPANALWRAESKEQPREWAREAGNNTPSIAQTLAPDESLFSPAALAAASALASSLRAKDSPLEDTYQPADFLTAFLTGGGGFVPRLAQAAMDPVVSAGMDYVPRIADAINPRNILQSIFGR